MIQGARYRVRSAVGVGVTESLSPASNERWRLPEGAIVVAAEVAAGNGGDARVRINSPAGWLSAADLEPAEPARSLRLDFQTFQERHRDVVPGDHYGLAFPFTLQMVHEWGPEFLTEAFRASGVMSPDNRVTAIVAFEKLTLMGASERAFLTIAYERAEPALQTELFVKVPPADPHHKFGLSASSHGEVEMLRLSRSGALPVTIPKYYYGDFCSQTSNYLLITERIPYGVPPVEPAYRKGSDHLIPDIEAHYRALAQALARLVAAHKIGTLGHEVETAFPFPRAARRFDPIPEAEAKIDTLIDFVGRIAPQLFVKAGTNPEFLRRWRADLLLGLEYKDAVIAYLHGDVDYTGLCHPNLNIDNAWYWRDQAGTLQVGLLDWGGVGQMSIAQALSGMLMMPDPDSYVRLVHDVICTFITEYEQKSGLALDPDELLFQYRASVFSTAICTILSIVVGHLSRFSETDYRSMKDRFDPRIQESGLGAAIIWIDNMLRDWLEPITPGDACRSIVARVG